MPSVFGARRRLTTSATATTYGHSARALTILAGTGTVMPFLFFDLSRPLPCGSGDKAASRATFVDSDPGAGSSWLSPSLPDRDTCSDAPPPRVAPRSTSGDRRCTGQRTKRRTRHLPKHESHISVFSRPVHALRREYAYVVPFLSDLWTSAVAGAIAERGGDPFSTPDRTKIHVPTLTREGQRHPVNRDAFHRCVRVRRPPVGLLRRTNPARRSLAHAAHTFSPSWGECLHGHCKHQSAVTRDPWHSRNRSPFQPMGSILSDLSCLGLTTQARPSARPSWLVCES